MLNLKCTYCGHLNPITSEYQTFCGGCNRKLEHNFADWHKLHPDKTFDDFTAQFGQPDEPLPSPKRRFGQSRIVKKDEHRRTKMLWGGLIGLFALIALIILGGALCGRFL